MKFTINQSIFNEVLSSANRAISGRPTHPVLVCFLIEAEATQGTVNVTGFDLAVGISTNISATVEKGGTCAVPAKLLMDIVSRLPEGELVFEESEMLLTLTSLSGSYEVRTMQPDEYPSLPDVAKDPLQQIEFNPEGLAAGIKNTAFAASTDEAKQVLAGIHLKVDENGLEFAATDGHRLSMTSVSPQDSDDDREAGAELFEVTIPLRVMREFERLLHKYSEPVVLNFSKDQVMLRTRSNGSATTIVARTLDGTYPNYPDLLPKSFARKITINRKALLPCLERISVFAVGKLLHCHFAVSEGDQGIVVSTETQDIGQGREFIEAQVTGGDITYGFNIKYLLDILRTAQSDEIELQGNVPLAPVVFKPVGDPNVTFLMMPTQIRGRQ